MNAEANMQEYLEEIREEVCSRCVERPPGGPPCTPLGKVCGVELHLPQLVAAVREVQCGLMDPYLARTRQKVCTSCPHLQHDCCPCPMDTLALLVVQAIEAVDQRHKPPAERPGAARVEEIVRAYEAAVGAWTGCDWPTAFGPALLDLNGMTAAEADVQAALADDLFEFQEENAWDSAAAWLREVEQRAREARNDGALAVAAARAGDWDDAVYHALEAWKLEFSTGRSLRRSSPTWRPLRDLVAAAAREQ